MMDILIATLIATVFVVPALFRPTLGRLVLSLLFVGGAAFNLLYTRPNAPGSLIALVATAPIPPYREVVHAAVAWNATPALVLAVIAFEAAAGLLILWRGRPTRVALLATGAWGLGMLPVIPPQGLLIGIATTGAPGLAALILARYAYPESVFTAAARTLHVQSVTGTLRVLIHPISAVLIFAAVWGLFLFVLHPWMMNWGSTPDEQAMALPGDEAPASAYFTR